MAKRIVSRLGLSSQLPVLKPGEFGYDYDTKSVRVGDDTPSAPRILTDKTEGSFDLSNVTEITFSEEVLESIAHHGSDGWTPIFASEENLGRILLRIDDWEGGSGTKPDVNGYISSTGIVTDPNLATNYRGQRGPSGSAPRVSYVVNEQGQLVFYITHDDETPLPMETEIDSEGNLLIRYLADEDEFAVNLGRVITLFRGAYSSGVAYRALDEVVYNYALYRVKYVSGTVVNIAPTNTDYWDKLYNIASEIVNVEKADQVGDDVTFRFTLANGSYYDVVAEDLKGPVGASFLSGSGNPHSSIGLNNDLYLNENNGAVFKKIGGSWVATGSNLKGPTGNDSVVPGPPGTTNYEELINTPDFDSDVFKETHGFAKSSNTVSVEEQSFTEVQRLQAQANIGQPLTFNSVSDLLSDEILAYNSEENKVAISVGGRIIADGYNYEVAADESVDFHVETSGGVKLYVKPSDDGYFHALAFGSVSSPSFDNIIPLQKWAKVSGAPRKGSIGTYEVSSNLDIANPDENLTDFAGMVIKPHSSFTDVSVVISDGWYNIENIVIDMGGKVDPDDTDTIISSGYDGMALSLGPSANRVSNAHIKNVTIRNATSHTNRDLLLIRNSDFMRDSGNFRFEDCRMRECLRIRNCTHSIIESLTTIRAGFRSATISNSSKNVIIRHINILDPADVGSLGNANLHLYMSGEAEPVMEDCFFEDVYVTPGTSPAVLVKLSRGALRCGLRRAQGRMLMAVLDDAVIGSRGCPEFIFEDIYIENASEEAGNFGAVLWAAPHEVSETGASNGIFRNIFVKGGNRRSLILVGQDGSFITSLTGLRIENVHIETNGNPFYLSRALTVSDCLIANSSFISTGSSRGLDLDLSNVVSVEIDFDNVRIETKGDAYAARLLANGIYRFNNSTIVRGINSGSETAIFNTGGPNCEFTNTTIKGGFFSPHSSAVWRNSENLSVPEVEVVSTDDNLTLQSLFNSSTILHTGTLTANRTITLSSTRPRGTFKVIRTGGGAFTLSVGGLKNLSTNEWCTVTYSGSEWVITEYGAL